MNEKAIADIVQLIRDGGNAATSALPELIRQMALRGWILAAGGLAVFVVACATTLIVVRKKFEGKDPIIFAAICAGIVGAAMFGAGITAALTPAIELLKLIPR